MPGEIIRIEKVPGDTENPRGQVVYTYDDGSVEKFGVDDEAGKTYIIDSDGTQRYLVEEQSRVAEKLKEDVVDFTNYIFFIPLIFANSTHEQEFIFDEVYFARECNFHGAVFAAEVSFESVHFLDGVSFTRATFCRRVSFNFSKFRGDAFFVETKFEDDAHFGSVGFADSAIFNLAKFSKVVIFQNITTSQTIDFESVYVEGLLILGRHPDMGGDDPLPVDLRGAVVNAIEYTAAMFRYANRETATVLKNLAIKQNDKVGALEFSKAEMEMHRDELARENGSRIDRFILCVEELISDFGTNPWRALGWLGFWNYLFFIAACCLQGSVPDFPAGFLGALGWGQMAYYSGNAFLIYELQKSLRKFSRRL